MEEESEYQYYDAILNGSSVHSIHDSYIAM